MADFFLDNYFKKLQRVVDGQLKLLQISSKTMLYKKMERGAIIIDFIMPLIIERINKRNQNFFFYCFKILFFKV